MLFEWVRQSGVMVGGVGAIVFPIYYWKVNPRWHRDEVSRFLMLGGFGWASLYLSGIIAIVFPSELARDIIRLVLIVGAGAFAWYQVWTLRRVRKQESDRDQKGGEDT